VKINFKFNLKYFLIAIAIFLTEILIATKLKDIFFVRAYLGDVFVVMLMYYFIRAFFDFEPVKLIVGIFIFSCLIEFLQYFHFGELLGFKDNRIMMIVLGNSFSWIDILCYLSGCAILLIIAIQRDRKRVV
jgi:DNA integrity scanning protein DisA with diadenylate cyclase activity